MLSETFKEYVEKYLESPVSAVIGVLAIISTLWGIVAIYNDVHAWLGSRIAGSVIAGLIGLCITPLAASALIPSFRRQYAFPTAKRFIFTEISLIWEIDAAYNATITNRKTYLFTDDPESIDLTDRAFCSETIDYKTMLYQSDDSYVTNQEKIKENLQRVFWQPKNGEVKIGIPYTHHVRSSFPFREGESQDWKGLAIAIPVRTLRVQVSVESKIPVRHAVVYKSRMFQRIRDDEEIAARGRKVKNPMAPPPTTINEYKLSWSMEKANPGSTYYFVIYF